MSAQSTPIGMDISKAATKRNNMVMQCMTRLEHFAYRALSVRGFSSNEFIIFCIMVDSQWRELIDILMPDQEAHWQSYRDQGAAPVARGIVNSIVCKYIIEQLPDLKASLEEQYPEGTACCVALDEGGGTVYQITAKEDKSGLS